MKLSFRVLLVAALIVLAAVGAQSDAIIWGT